MSFLYFHKIKTVGFIFFSLLLSCLGLNAQYSNFSKNEKINGVSVRLPYHPILNAQMVENVKASKADWVAFVPEVVLERTTLKLQPDSLNSNWGETQKGIFKGVEMLKNAGFKVMLKPHVILSNSIPNNKKIKVSINKGKKRDKTRGAEWRGDFKAKNEADWEIWEKEYEAYILQLAEVADSFKVDILSIGAELRESAVRRPEYWRSLVKKIREVYHGKLTYSANWDEYEKVAFWDDLDYIGVDTYFPVNTAGVPKVRKTLRNWRRISKRIKRLGQEYNRPILLTEFGYRSIEYAGRKPWLHDKGKDRPSSQAQVNLYEAFFKSFWRKDWIVGGFLWKWYADETEVKATDFSPQGKPALNVVRHWFSK